MNTHFAANLFHRDTALRLFQRKGNLRFGKLTFFHINYCLYKVRNCLDFSNYLWSDFSGGRPKVLDVTNEYVEVIDITIKNYSQFSRIYLATFNNGKYNINSIGEPIGNK